MCPGSKWPVPPSARLITANATPAEIECPFCWRYLWPKPTKPNTIPSHKAPSEL